MQSDDKEFIKFDKVSFAGTFGPLRNVMTSRVVRHFCQIYLNAYEEDSLKKIFKFTINYVFTKNKIKFGEMMNKIVDSTIQL